MARFCRIGQCLLASAATVAAQSAGSAVAVSSPPVNVSEQEEEDAPSFEHFELGHRKAELWATGIPLLLLEAMAWRAAHREVGQAPPLPATYNSKALDIFRFLAVLHVAFFHEHFFFGMSHDGWHRFAVFGRWWVQFFFILSGFVLAMSQKVGTARWDFLVRRLRGVYPGYLAGALLGLCVHEHDFWTNLLEYIGSYWTPPFTMMETWLPPFGDDPNPNVPAWFLSALLYFWLRFPDWHRVARQSPGACAALSVATATSLACVESAYGSQTPFAYFSPCVRWPSFVFGLALFEFVAMGLAVAQRDAEEGGGSPLAPICAKLCSAPILRKACGTFSLLTICIVALTAFELMDSPLKPFIDNQGPLLMLPFGALIAYVPMGDDVLLRPSLLASDWGVWLGAVSSSLFILHCPVRMAVAKFFWREAPVLAMLLSEVLVAICFHEVVQKRLNAYGGARHRARPEAASVKPGADDVEAEFLSTSTSSDSDD